MHKGFIRLALTIVEGLIFSCKKVCLNFHLFKKIITFELTLSGVCFS